MARSRRRRRLITLSGGGVAVIAAALITASATIWAGDSKDPKSATSRNERGATSGDCSGNDISGNGNTLNCGPEKTPAPTPSPTPEPDRAPPLRGNQVPLNCLPPGARFAKSGAVEVVVRLWCSQRLRALLADRRAVQTKVKLAIVNRTQRRLDVRVERWYLLVEGTVARRRWSGPEGWRRPVRMNFQGRPVTAIAANPDDQSELQEETTTYRDYTFETHWRTDSLAPSRTFRPKARPRDPGRRDGVLVFYAPLGGDRRSKSPRVIGLALTDSRRRVVAFCPQGSWRDEVSAETF